MTKIRAAILLMVAFCFGLAHAGMRRTENCKATIKSLEEKIAFLTKCKDPQQDKFEDCWWVLSWIREKKRKEWMPKKIGELSKELKDESVRLIEHQKLVLKEIAVKAEGSWDTCGGPEIRIIIGGQTIDGECDRSELYQSALNIDVSSVEISVVDRDVMEEEKMGKIDLKKSEIPRGVKGDSYIRNVPGSDWSSGQGHIEYTVIYEVQY